MRLRPPLILSVPDAVTSWALNRRCHPLRSTAAWRLAKNSPPDCFCLQSRPLPTFYILFLLKINKRTVPALTCPYNYRHRMMTILFLLQAWHGYRFTFTQGRSAFLADAASLASFSPKMSSCRKSVFSDLPWPTICVWFRTLFLESFSELRFRLCFFYFERKLYFSQKKKTVWKRQP